MIQKFSISRDDTYYHAFPDVVLTPSGKLLSVISECTHHGDRSYTRVVLRESADRGRTWGPKRPLTESTTGMPFGNCPRIMPLDFDRSPKSDLGYSGWVQFPDGEIYVVGYIVDDWPRGQIRGYAFGPDEFLLPGS